MIIGKPDLDLPQPAIDDYVVVTLMHINDAEPLPMPVPPTTNGATS
jgi:hypothetical protein